MWTDKTRNAKISSASNRSVLSYGIVKLMKILILIFFFEIEESKTIRVHNLTLVKKQSRLDVRKFSFSMVVGPSVRP